MKKKKKERKDPIQRVVKKGKGISRGGDDDASFEAIERLTRGFLVVVAAAWRRLYVVMLMFSFSSGVLRFFSSLFRSTL